MLSTSLESEVARLQQAVDGAVELIRAYDQAALGVIQSEDDAGCDGNLTVIAKTEFEELKRVYERRSV